MANQDTPTPPDASVNLTSRSGLVNAVRAIPIRWRILSIAALNSAVVLVLATVMRRWTFRLAPGHVVEMEPLITLRPRHGMPMLAHQREGAMAEVGV